jgi:hypothetical protein
MPLFTRSRTREEGTTLFFASDLHGSEVCWRKFVAAADFYGADLLVLGGDFTGKLVVPVVSAGDRHRARFMGKEHDLHPDELPAFERRVADAGFYTLRSSPGSPTPGRSWRARRGRSSPPPPTTTPSTWTMSSPSTEATSSSTWKAGWWR